MSAEPGVMDRLRQPEYTGEDRCLPCTAANLLVAATIAVSIGLVVPTPAGLALGTTVLAVSLAAIYLRGYFVPGTPRITETYFPDWLLARFEKEPMRGSETGVEITEQPVPERFDVETALSRGGILTDCADVDDLYLDTGFRDAWRARIDEFADDDLSRGELASVLDVEPDHLTFDHHGDAFVAHVGSKHVGQWESREAFLADVAATRELSTRLDGWDDWNVDLRGRVLTGVRLFVEICPSCGGPVRIEEDVVESCCRSVDVAAGTCGDCGARLFETRIHGAP